MKKVIFVFILLLASSAFGPAQAQTAESNTETQSAGSNAPGVSNTDYYQLGLAHYQSKRFKAAVEAFRRALQLKPNDADIYYNLGMAYYSQNRYKEAAEAFKQSARIKPDSADAHFRLGWMYYILGQKGPALDQYRILQRLNPDRARMLYKIVRDDLNSATSQPAPTTAGNGLRADAKETKDTPAAGESNTSANNASTPANIEEPRVESKLVISDVNPPTNPPAPTEENPKPASTETNAATANTTTNTAVNNNAPPAAEATTGAGSTVKTAPPNPTPTETAAPAKNDTTKAPENVSNNSAGNVADNNKSNAATGSSNTTSRANNSSNASSSGNNKANEEASPVNIYRIGPGDVLDIRLVNTPNVRSTLYTVMDGGLIEFPLAGGPLMVGGLTTDEINARLSAELKRRAVGDGKQQEVIVSVREYSSHVVVITGLVNSPGMRILHREAVPLYAVLAEAQPRADAGRALIMRASGQIPVDLSDPAQMNLLVQPGDVITVTLRPPQFYYLGGKITTPGQKPFQSGITLTQAILAAGGLERATEDNVEISREGTDGRLTTTKYRLREIKAGRIPDPRLQPGDRVEVGH